MSLRRQVVAGGAVTGGGGAEACHFRRGQGTVVEGVASIDVAASTAARDVAADETGSAARWRHRCRRERRREACLQAVAGKLLRRSRVVQESLLFCRRSRRKVDGHTTSCASLAQFSSDLTAESAKSLWKRRQQFVHCFGLPINGVALCRSIFSLFVIFTNAYHFFDSL